MIYTNYANMKKGRFSFADRGHKYIIDSAAIIDAVRRCKAFEDVPGGYPCGVVADIISGSINRSLGLSPASWDVSGFRFVAPSGRVYYVDFECNKTAVYNDQGRQLYQLLSVKACRVSSYASDDVCSLPDLVQIFGGWRLSPGVCVDAVAV